MKVFILCVVLSGSLFYYLQNNTSIVMDEMKGPVKVELKEEEGSYQLYVDGNPFWIDGAGLEFGSIPALAENGGNSFRTWRTENGRRSGREVLDEAHKHGLYVTMGIEVARERHGFDYDDEAAVAEQFERIKKEILLYKDHPSLIIWAIGNELNLSATNPKVWDAVNEISEYIHEVDANHLTTTTVAGMNKKVIDDIKERARDLDLLSIQMYADIVNIKKRVRDYGWKGPYMVTEWGATGHWEIPKTEWGIPIENNSSLKADLYLERYQKAIAPNKDRCVGSYVFLWGQKQERTPTWYGLFLKSGEKTESVDVMHYLWKGKWPDNRSPRLDSLLLDDKNPYQSVHLTAGQTYDAVVHVSDPEGDELKFSWEVKPESTNLGHGGDYEPEPETIPGLINRQGTSRISLKAPEEPGPYRLFVYVFDGNNSAAHANIPFFVDEK